MEIDKNFKEFIELLNEYKVQYLVIGGYAVNFHGYPRYTKDIDFWLWMTEDNIKNLLQVIKDFGFGGLQLTIKDFMNANNIIQLGYEPYRIDLLVDIEGVDFEECFNRKVATELEGININFLSLQDLIDIKKTTGRLQDLADAEQLEKIKPKQEDENQEK